MADFLGDHILWQRAQDYLARHKPHLIAVAGTQNAALVSRALTQLKDQLPSPIQPSQGPVSEPGQIAAAILNTSYIIGCWRALVGSRVKELEHDIPKTIILNLKAERPGDVELPANKFPFNTAILTGTGDYNLGLFGTRAMVAHEYASLAAALPRQGLAIINADDPLLMEASKHFICEVITVGENPIADIRLTRADRLGLSGFAGVITVTSRQYEFTTPHLVAKSQLIAVLVAAAIAHKNGQNIPQALTAVQNLKPERGAMQLITGHNNAVIIDDSAEATPQSIVEALKTLSAMPGHMPRTHEKKPRRIAIIGDCLDLGAETAKAYETIGQHAAISADVFVGVGEEIKKAQAQALKSGPIDTHHFETSRSAGKWFKEYIKEGDIVLVTGGEQMRMHHIVEALKAV
jgi:UDP-N-acetylmuramoyl-tripeptide--D-alanyl-D-alanine ligase